jgi:hypothetical protein
MHTSQSQSEAGFGDRRISGASGERAAAVFASRELVPFTYGSATGRFANMVDLAADRIGDRGPSP